MTKLLNTFLADSVTRVKIYNDLKRRLDFQPLFGKRARGNKDQTRESGGNRAYLKRCLKWLRLQYKLGQFWREKEIVLVQYKTELRDVFCLSFSFGLFSENPGVISTFPQKCYCLHCLGPAKTDFTDSHTKLAMI